MCACTCVWVCVCVCVSVCVHVCETCSSARAGEIKGLHEADAIQANPASICGDD